MGLGSGIQDPRSGSRGQKGTKSRIRNIGYYSLVGMVAELFMQTAFCSNNFDLHAHLNLSMVNLRFPFGFLYTFYVLTWLVEWFEHLASQKGTKKHYIFAFKYMNMCIVQIRYTVHLFTNHNIFYSFRGQRLSVQICHSMTCFKNLK